MAGNNNHATKADLKALREELKGDMATLREQLTEAFQEAIHDSETRLLKAFYEFAESNRLRLVATETVASTLTRRLDIVESKLMAIEKKLNLPNAS